MKHFYAFVLFMFVTSFRALPAEQPLTSRVINRSADARTIATPVDTIDPDGSHIVRTNLVTEVASGMHFQKDGEWIESEETIEAIDGGAAALHGAHKATFSQNLNTFGGIHLTSPNGTVLQSHVLALAYTDVQNGTRVFFGTLKDSVGQIQPPNQVIYANAFEGMNADVRYT